MTIFVRKGFDVVALRHDVRDLDAILRFVKEAVLVNR